MSKRILLVGGGTGGHVFPLVAVAESLRQLTGESGTAADLLIMGDGKLLKSEANTLGVKFRPILTTKWRRYFSFLNFFDLFKAPLAFIQAIFWLWLFMPDVVFAKGSHGSFWPLIAAKILFVPFVIHESDAVPGAVNSFFGNRSRRVFLGFESTENYFPKKETVAVGVPIRKAIREAARSQDGKQKALQAFGFNGDLPVILVSGASQGAKALNDLVLLAIVELTKKYNIIHQAGEANFEEVQKKVAAIVEEQKDSFGPIIMKNYKVVPFFSQEQIILAYGASDVIICRSGSQVFETAIMGKPTIVVPLPGSSKDHQILNAREFAKYGAVLIEQSNLTPHILMNEIDKAYANREKISEKIKSLPSFDAADTIARYLLDEEF